MSVSDWNYADIWDVIAAVFPEREALVQGDIRRTWSEFEARAAALGGAFQDAGLARQAKVAEYLFNSPAYLETVYGCFKGSLVPVNTNYRYTEEELFYLWDNSDAEAIVFHSSFTERVERVRDRLTKVKLWICVDNGPPAPEWALPYEIAAGGSSAADAKRSGDDLVFLYTGGTTGMPKGVMWRQDDMISGLNTSASLRYDLAGGLAGVRTRLREFTKYEPSRLLPGPPLMHGTGFMTAVTVLASAGTVVMPSSEHFDPIAILDLIESERVTEMSIVGDAFARPLLTALDAEPDRWDISSLWLVMSSGVMWSAELKEGLLRHHPKLILADTLGSSEALGMARSTSRSGSTARTAGFVLGPDARVIADDGKEVSPGSGDIGRLVLRGRGPLGYYKDEAKSAATFVVIDGERYVIPGDFATVADDGTVQLLGRGSVCINTGGEKVFPEEVEEAVKLHPAVADAVVVGVPDDRFGEAVTAVVEAADGRSPDPQDLVAMVKARIAAYKAPRHIVFIDTIGRSPAGKVDYKRLRAYAAHSLGLLP